MLGGWDSLQRHAIEAEYLGRSVERRMYTALRLIVFC